MAMGGWDKEIWDGLMDGLMNRINIHLFNRIESASLSHLSHLFGWVLLAGKILIAVIPSL